MYIQPIKKNYLIKDSASLVGMGIVLQENGDYVNSKALLQQGIDKIKKVLITDNSSNKEMILEYVYYY